MRLFGTLLALLFAVPTLAAPAPPQVLHGHLPAGATPQTPTERVAGARRLDLSISLPLRNRDALTNLLQQLYDPASPRYHHFLTPAEFALRFGPTEQDYQELVAFSQKKGFAVVATHPNRTLLDVNGQVTDIERAFHLTLRVYRHPSEARNFFAPDVEPSLDLATPVLAIGGLDDFVLPRPMGLRTSLAEPRLLAKSWTTGTGPRGAFIGRDFRSAYAPGVELDGSGQAVGLFELDGYYPSDVTAYETLAGLPQIPLSDVLVNGPIPNPGQGNIEVALDIDMAISMAPCLSRIFVYQGHIPNDVLNRMATDNAAKQLSCSWGFGAQVDAARDQIFLQYAAQGQSFFQASGDYGAWTGPAMAPSDNPYITIVGGTSLTTSGPGGTWLAETAWAFGGGGISTAYPIPAWQQGLNLLASQGSTLMRNFPDVACVADDSIWLVANNGQQAVVGGTSASTPLWAGFTALANQQAASAGLPSVGFVNPALYALGKGTGYGAAFHDIVTGNNTNGGSANKFWAVPGFDLCTGWGTPAGSNLLQALVAPPSALQISPAARFLFTGPASGPLNPPGVHYTLTNTGAVSLNWSLVNTSLWVDVSPTNGTLAPGAAAMPVSVTLNSMASNLVAGAYSSTLRFLSANEQLSQSRQVTLAIVSPPVLTTQPASQTVPQGAMTSFSVAAAPNALLFYQWRHGNGSPTNLADGENISGSATAALTISNVSAPDVGAYSVVVSNVAGAVTSSNALLALMASPPMLTAQPASQNVLPGQTLRLTVEAIGTLPLFYSWRANSTNLRDGGRLSGSASTTLIVSNVSAADAATYSVLVSNSLGSTISSNATVAVATVTAPGVDLVRLWSFSGGTGGPNPNGLMQAVDGKFYGTTQRGGANDAGTIFQLTSAGVLTPLYTFIAGSDGATPFAPLVQDADGNFYGTAVQGGAFDEGTVFRMSASGLVAPLATFNITNGDLPFAGLTRGADGAFYGTTCQGGASHLGEVFRITTNGALTTLYSFSGQDDGGLAHAGLMQGADGLFYGATFQGGTYHGGTIFKVTTNGMETTMVSLDSTNGSFPFGGLVQDSSGMLYGAASGGGRFGNGAVFRMTPAGLLTNLHSFTGGSDGARPAAALLLGSDGNFYGTAAYGGLYGQGTLFRMLPDGTLTNLACFDGYNGANPQAALIEGSDGNIYGTTQNGGDSGQGVAFQLRTFGAPQITARPASQTVFVGSNVLFSAAAFGSAPLSWQWQKNGTNLMNSAGYWGSTGRTLMLSNVSLDGTGTYSVTVSNALGSVTSAPVLLAVLSSPPLIVQQPASLTLAPPGATARFSVAATGNLPLSFQWQRNGTNLADSASISGSASSVLALAPITEADNGTYAVTVSNTLAALSSSNAVLTVIPVSAAGTRMTTLRWFDGSNDASNPNALVAGTNGSLFGTTQFGGQQHAGTVFVISTNGVVNTLASFSPFAGAGPRAGLIQGADGNFYGTAASGGANNAGSVFQMTPDGVFSNLYSFRGDADGAEPLAPVAQGRDGSFYGTTSAGNVFRLSPGGPFTNLYSSAAGDIPSAGLVQGTDGNFYGVGGSGTFGFGAVFRMSSDGVLTNLHSFTGDTDGRLPAGLLVQAADGNFYGAATHSSLRGFPLYGTIFKMTPGGTLTPLYVLNFTDGPYPHAGLTAGADGNFYGTSYGSEFGPISQGPSASNGTIFRITPGGSLTTLLAFDGLSDGAHPASAPLFGVDGSLYGTTTAGGPGASGTVFRLSFAPQITRSPANLTVSVGARVDFTVRVFGTAPLFYQWLQNGTNLVDGTNLSGVATATLTLSNLTPANAGQYSVIVTNALGSVTSATARLNIVFPPVFQSPSQTNGIVTLSWSALAGQRYQLQYRPGLSAGSWNNLGASLVAIGTNLTASDSIGSATQRFYRVILLPQ